MCARCTGGRPPIAGGSALKWRGVLSTAFTLFAGCSPARAPIAPPAPATFDLSGDWISGFDTDPSGTVVRLTRPCGETVTAWRFTHAGSDLTGYLIRGAAL